MIGLVSIPLTHVWLAIGIAERIPMYSVLGWAALTGASLLLPQRADERQSLGTRAASSRVNRDAVR